MERITIPALHQMKRNGQKITGVVAWDFHVAQIADRAGVEIVSVGDSIGVHLWGRDDTADITVDEMLIVCGAVRRGTRRAMVSCDMPSRLLEKGIEPAVIAARRLVDEAGADMVKVECPPGFDETVTAIARVGIPVFAQFEMTANDTAESAVNTAQQLEAAGAALIDFKYSGTVAGPAVVKAVQIPVLGGMGGGPWLDGRIRMAHAAIGYAANTLDSAVESYANVAAIVFDALTAYANDVRSGRQIKGSKRI